MAAPSHSVHERSGALRRGVEGAVLGGAIAAIAGAAAAGLQALLSAPDAVVVLAAAGGAALAAEIGVRWARRIDPARSSPAPVAAGRDATSRADVIRGRGPVGAGAPAIDLWRRVALRSMHADGPDLSTRQMALLLTVYADGPTKSVGELADELGVAKPVISRAVDTLAGFGLLERRRDEDDRRKVFVERTVAGAAYLPAQSDLLEAAHAEAGRAAADEARLARVDNEAK